jgi:dUTP pyrophosphatase
MYKIAKFEKVSFEQFLKDYQDCFHEYDVNKITNIYNSIKLPSRATKAAAGYDFYSYFDFDIAPGETIKIPTGIRCKFDENWVLIIVPRSSLGFKYRIQLDNTIGVIDADYYGSSNEGHIFIKLTNDGKSNKIACIKKDNAIAQGIFLIYGLTEDDNVTATRNGGFGSTDK